jgi:solute carrier family 25 protein 44
MVSDLFLEWREYSVLHPPELAPRLLLSAGRCGVFPFRMMNTANERALQTLEDNEEDDFALEDLRKYDPKKFIFWGLTVSFFAEAATFPLDLVKTRMQFIGQQAAKSTFQPYRNTFNAFHRILKEEGLRGFYKGFSSSALAVIPVQVTYYGTYEGGRMGLEYAYKKLKRKSKSLPDYSNVEPIVHFVMGGMAEGISGFVWVPLDAIAQKMQIQGPSPVAGVHKYHDVFDAIVKIWRTEGVIGYYRGYWAAMMYNAPISAVSWPTYEYFKKKLYHFYNIKRARRYERSHQLGIFGREALGHHLIHIIAGTLSGICAAVVCNPIDVIRTRLQTQDTAIVDPITKQLIGQPAKYRGVFGTFKTIYREEGLTAFRRGMVAQMLYLAPINGFGYTMYELVKVLSRRRWDNSKKSYVDH